MKVLVVEDNYLIAKYLAHFLESEGYEVAGPCASPDKAIELIRKEELEGAILDVSLGKRGDSLGVAEELAARGIPFAFASGIAGETAILDDFADIALLRKPIADAELRETIASFSSHLSSRR